MTATGELYTWGKGRYGRLGHGDSDDQLKPKMVEALTGYRVVDVACGELWSFSHRNRGLFSPILFIYFNKWIHILGFVWGNHEISRKK